MRYQTKAGQILPGAVALALLAAPLAAQVVARMTEREAAAALADGRLTPERERAFALARNLGPRAGAELRGETDRPEGSEAGFGYMDAVSRLRDPRAIPFLVEVLAYGTGAANALADLAPESFPAVLEAVSNPDENPLRVSTGLSMGLTALRFMVEDGALAAGQVERVRGVARERLSGTQQYFPVKAAVRLALALGNPELREMVERVANDRAAAEALVSPYLPSGNLSEDPAGRVDRVQEEARLFLSGGGADIGPVRRPGSG
ncbi:MAG: hypothetical protein OXH08_04170 [Gammaproteobacteria bacterium]|nr:hypothetical protein [Gammaproteobacteria bacterium]MDE0652006.1 hypothetical protein [Gammaproteobacteria bacterium]